MHCPNERQKYTTHTRSVANVASLVHMVEKTDEEEVVALVDTGFVSRILSPSEAMAMNRAFDVLLVGDEIPEDGEATSDVAGRLRLGMIGVTEILLDYCKDNNEGKGNQSIRCGSSKDY